MPFTHPFAKVLCPFCFEYFHLGQAPVRILNSSKTENDTVVRDFLGYPENQKVYMQHVEKPEGLFNRALRYFYYPKIRDAFAVKRRICPYCHMPLPDLLANGGKPCNIIAVTGYRNSGKSNFMGVLIHELIYRYTQEVGFSLTSQGTFSISGLEAMNSFLLYKKRYGSELLGDNPMVVHPTYSVNSKAEARIPLIFRLDLTRFTKKQRLFHPLATFRPVLLVFFDAAGEDMDSPDTLAIYYRYISRAAGIIALIDPLSYREIRNDISMNYNATKYEKEPFDTIGILKQTIEKSGFHSSSQKIKTPIAVTISKFDLLRNIDSLNSSVFQDHVHSSGFDALAADKTSNNIRDYLDKRIPFFTDYIEHNFKTYKYFGMSALGRSPLPDAKLPAIEPINIADSLFWILNQLNYLQTEEEMKESTRK